MTPEERCRKIQEYFADTGQILVWERGHGAYKGELGALIRCPGIHLHTEKNQPADCTIYSKPGCHIHCFHESCHELVEVVRKAVSQHVGERVSREEQQKRAQHSRAFVRAVSLVKTIKAALPSFYRSYSESAQGINRKLDPPRQWDLFFGMFAPADILWIGQPHDSGYWGTGHFRSVAQWRQLRKYAQFVCQGLFDSSNRSTRAASGIIARPYRVIEFDQLDPDPEKNKFCSLALTWALSQRLKFAIRVQIDTGNKSIHTWVNNDPEIFDDVIVTTLRLLGADGKVLGNANQIVRFPGVPYDRTRQQTLIYHEP